MRPVLERLYRPVVQLWNRARNERSSPPELGLSVGIGVFAACTPFLGAHLWIALGLATLLRLNRLWALLASRLSVFPMFALISFAEIQSAHRLRTGVWADLLPASVFSHGRDFVVDWALGTAVVGGALAAIAGLLAYVAVRG